MSVGWISIHRKIMDHWIWSDPVYLKAWVTILMEVNHESKKVLIKGKLLECGRGQSLNSLSRWGTLFGSWSTKRVKNFFENLERDKMVVVESVRVTTRISVLNYEKYQGHGNAEETQKKRTGNAEETQKKRKLPTNNNGNNGNNEKNANKGIRYYDEAKLVGEYLLKCIMKIKPDFKQPNMKSWVTTLERAIRLDNRDPRQLCEVAKWATNDPFWQSNILSATKLRKQFDQLQMKMRQPGEQTMEEHGSEWLALAEDKDEIKHN